MTDISGFGFADDVSFVRHLIEKSRCGGSAGVQFFFRF